METVTSDKKEIGTISIKISVDSTDLDKLEAQLKRIEVLMVSVGLKEPTSEAISTEQSEFEKFKQQVKSEFSQLQSSITALQHTQTNSEIASVGAIEQVRTEIQRKASLDL